MGSVNLKQLKKKFDYQKWAAVKERNIPWELSFDEWLQIWNDSGKLAERGCRKGQYCMSRFGDKGPYSIDNVEIKTQSENTAEYNRNREMTIAIKNKISAGVSAYKRKVGA